jgi:hypothetical protein
VTGLAHSRATDHLKKLDLTNFQETDAFFETARPDCELCIPDLVARAPLTKSLKG